MKTLGYVVKDKHAKILKAASRAAVCEEIIIYSHLYSPVLYT